MIANHTYNMGDNSNKCMIIKRNGGLAHVRCDDGKDYVMNLRIESQDYQKLFPLDQDFLKYIYEEKPAPVVPATIKPTWTIFPFGYK